ncbi:hypothetical protein TNIN_499261 [Trichonephila inaurata madagascariensis]|uniref:Uncharacterized protein n=1 Tax=Trichonephila inaurata madagascariensis TaxID=2747483 RepID=A0A8X6YUK5_9ARAC|nr:hypothetical protein TNIN_499261 [Trichonephila inaurata madagascariensis]
MHLYFFHSVLFYGSRGNREKTPEETRKSFFQAFSKKKRRRRAKSRLREKLFRAFASSLKRCCGCSSLRKPHSQLQITVSEPIYENICIVQPLLSTLPKGDRWDICGISKTG